MELAQRLGGAQQQLAAGDLLRRTGREVLVGLGGLGEPPDARWRSASIRLQRVAWSAINWSEVVPSLGAR